MAAREVMNKRSLAVSKVDLSVMQLPKSKLLDYIEHERLSL